MFLVDSLHQNEIGVFLDWVPSHFPEDEFGLNFFDGSHLYEHADPKRGYHPDWKSLIFNYGRREVRNFLIANALYWLKTFHMDGLRVDAVASMLYLDYSRKSGEWIPNIYGGRENLEAITFLKILNETVYHEFPDVHMMAEESTAWPMVSRPTYIGGLGFGMKWDMGWMHDTLKYFQQDPIHRKYHHDKLTFRMVYAFNENFLLSLSHDEVVYGKGSLLNKMPGDKWQKLANLRCLLGYLYTQPGKKLLFMGGEIAQEKEWNHDQQLEWELLKDPAHAGIQTLVRDLNYFYKNEACLYKTDFSHEGFRWLDHHDNAQSVLSFFRILKEEYILVILNCTPVPRPIYRLGVPRAGIWQVRINSDKKLYGGSGNFEVDAVRSIPEPSHGYAQSLNLNLPPLAAFVLKWQGEK
jgi:1,4-alpha-glucan branching enzyme